MEKIDRLDLCFSVNQPKDYKIIVTYNGLSCKVDNEDFDYLKKIPWKMNKNFYACNTTYGLMHRIITKCEKGKVVDHINHDTTDNRKSNLRICTNNFNSMNSRKIKLNKSSVYKGVSWYKRDGIWTSYIMISRKRIYLGRFKCEIEAAKAYDKKAKELFGEYAYLNFKTND